MGYFILKYSIFLKAQPRLKARVKSALKKERKTHEKFFDLLGSRLRINGFHLYHVLLRVVIGGIKIIGHMELMTMCILMHIIMLA